MLQILLKRFSFFTILTLFFSCSSTQKVNSQEQNKQVAGHIILIGIDGFGAYAFEKAKIPNIRKMMKNGSYSLQARSVLPSSSAVNWASMLMGSGPELHGFTEWDSQEPELPSATLGESGIYPTIFSVIDTQLPKAKKGAIYTWGGIRNLFERELVELYYNGETDTKTIEKATSFIIEEKPVFTFIHLDDADHTGHKIGFDSPEYYNEIEKIDTLIGKMIASLEAENLLKETIIILTSDHGGNRKSHGGKTLKEVEIPWIIFGKGISNKGKLESTIVTYDTGATIAYLLGLRAPEFWRGKPVINILML
ncbi:type I phosphodiesterase/nucleotide pyrophosphatase [Gillisia sp. Hel_I_86]|uniref:alkaline phosphatase n=1 Tax=Gillisia sp. Hel_I_86 TaxID=1249981 RepID=UPI00119B7E28|nr:alkaline phosphatase [Gillisia sp. Hel_I_86]TVZ26680.1 type I phosphodiesterase/nucleotide pyrophosphatase [Gillisia sp. Hel_I_86]